MEREYWWRVKGYKSAGEEKVNGEGPDKPPPILLTLFCSSKQNEKEGIGRKGGWEGQVAELLDGQCLFSPILIYEVVLFIRSVSKQATLWHWRPLLFPLLYFQTGHCARVSRENQGPGQKGGRGTGGGLSRALLTHRKREEVKSPWVKSTSARVPLGEWPRRRLPTDRVKILD